MRQLFWLWVFAMVLAEARAGVITFSVDPVRSVVELQGTVLAFGLNLSLNEQAAGSMKVSWRGTLRAEVSDSTVRFVSGNWVPLMESGVWQPDTNGFVGSAPANYGARAGVNLSLIVSGHAAFRQMGFEMISPELTLQSGQFPVRQIEMRFVEAAKSAVDYRFSLTNNPGDPDFALAGAKPQAVLATLTAAGRTLLQGEITNRATNAARLFLENGVQTMTIPIDARYVFVARANTGDEFRFSLLLIGQLVAIPGAIVEYQPAIPGGPIRLSWPPGYRLQRATEFSPGGWSDLATDSPLEVPTHESLEYFRAIRVVP